MWTSASKLLRHTPAMTTRRFNPNSRSASKDANRLDFDEAEKVARDDRGTTPINSGGEPDLTGREIPDEDKNEAQNEPIETLDTASSVDPEVSDITHVPYGHQTQGNVPKLIDNKAEANKLEEQYPLLLPATTKSTEESLSKQSFGNTMRSAGTWAKNNPGMAAGAAVGTAGVITIAAPTLVFAPALGLAGFGSSGVVAGSAAAGVQAGIGNVAAGSAFAVCQSAAAGGAGVATVAAVTQVAGGVAAAGGGAYAWVKGKKKGGNESEKGSTA